MNKKLTSKIDAPKEGKLKLKLSELYIRQLINKNKEPKRYTMDKSNSWIDRLKEKNNREEKAYQKRR